MPFSDLFDRDDHVAIGTGELDGVNDRLAAAEMADGAEGSGEFFGQSAGS